MDDFQESLMRQKLAHAMQAVTRILEANKSFCLAGDVHHQYQDKFALSEFLTNTIAASQVNCLALLGLDAEKLKQLRAWAATSTVSLCFKLSENMKLINEELKEVESKTKHVTEIVESSGSATTVLSRVVNTVTEYTWRVEIKYELSAVKGVSESIVLMTHSSSADIKTTQNRQKKELANSYGPEMCNISWLVKHLSDELSPCFHIDRQRPDCHTPVRNPDLNAALDYLTGLENWAQNVREAFLSMVHSGCIAQLKPDERQAIEKILDQQSFFVPVLPLLQSENAANQHDAPKKQEMQRCAGMLSCFLEGTIPEGGMIPSIDDANHFLAEETRILQDKHAELKQDRPSGCVLMKGESVALIMTLMHFIDAVGQHKSGVMYVERLLRKQLIAAIGKEITPKELAEYMVFHNRKLFSQQYAPLPFCYSVRRSEKHSPEGNVSIEQLNADAELSPPIYSIAAHNADPRPMTFALSASSTATFGGDRYLHAVLQHKFSDTHHGTMQLVARARQFSSFLVLVGQISSSTSFSPKYGAIIQNQDELKIPLELLTIPTPKEFKDAIESLSPEQQSFARAFRAMQLESTLFGVLVIQIKPQLEKVLNLPEDSLTKEIKLTQDLMQLFIKYQIPSDLLSFDNSDDATDMELVGATTAERLAAVKEHVKAMHSMIEQSKQEELEARKKETMYHQGSAMFGEECAVDSDPPSPAMMSRCLMMMEYDECEAAPAPVFAAAPVSFAAPQACRAAPVSMACASTPVCLMSAVPNQSPPQQAPPTALSEPPAPIEASTAGASSGTCGNERDYTTVPKQMDQKFEKLDPDSALRPTRIKPGDLWRKKSQKSLLASPTCTSLDADEQEEERNAAFDLLEALTKSGALPIDKASLHIIVAATHCFDKTITECVVQDNVNPIDKIERSTLIMAETVHQQPPSNLICRGQHERVKASSPMLFISNSEAVG